MKAGPSFRWDGYGLVVSIRLDVIHELPKTEREPQEEWAKPCSIDHPEETPWVKGRDD
jgi:hypothetical protein